MNFEQTINEVHSLVYTRRDNAYEANRNRIILKVFLNDLSKFEGFHKKVAATVLASIINEYSDFYIGICSQKQAEYLAEAALKFGVRFCRPAI